MVLITSPWTQDELLDKLLAEKNPFRMVEESYLPPFRRNSP